jgi:ribosome-associated toxin RatA of RatAB toxin-antitoxin module
MKELSGSASTAVDAPIEECFALVAALDRYPSWYPDVVRAAEVVARDDAGHPTRTRTTLHASIGPISRDFALLMTVTVEEFSTVRLSRIPHDGSDPERFDVHWRLQAGAQTRIDLTLAANLSIPRLVPVTGIGDTMAGGFVDAVARALAAERQE